MKDHSLLAIRLSPSRDLIWEWVSDLLVWRIDRGGTSAFPARCVLHPRVDITSWVELSIEELSQLCCSPSPCATALRNDAVSHQYYSCFEVCD